MANPIGGTIIYRIISIKLEISVSTCITEFDYTDGSENTARAVGLEERHARRESLKRGTLGRDTVSPDKRSSMTR